MASALSVRACWYYVHHRGVAEVVPEVQESRSALRGLAYLAGLCWVAGGISCDSQTAGKDVDAAESTVQQPSVESDSGALLDDVGPTYEAPAAVPRWSADDVSAHIAADLPYAVPNLVQLVDTYLWIMGSGDTACPGSSTQLTGVDPESGCISEDGFWYYGVASYILTDSEESYRQVLSGDFELRTPEGLSLACGGHVGVEWNTGAGGSDVAIGTLLGTWAWGGASDSLVEAVSASLVVGRVDSASGDGPARLWLEGGLSTSMGSWTFEDFVIFDGCEGRPTGRVYLYDSGGGHWYTLDLEEDCSGCGQVSFGTDEKLGRVCPSWTGMAEQIADSVVPL